MVTVNCPSCGGPVEFKSSYSVFSVCSYCSSMLVRHDMDLENLGKMATLPPDMSPLQLGARGRYQTKNFLVVGRLKIAWEHGIWNEWYVLLDDGRDGWLAEAQGQWMISFEVSGVPVPPVTQLTSESSLEIPGKGLFQVNDIKQTTCQGSEGELPMKAPQGRKATAVDISNSKNEFGTLDYSEEGVHVYLGNYMEFEEFQFMGLREFDGW